MSDGTGPGPLPLAGSERAAGAELSPVAVPELTAAGTLCPVEALGACPTGLPDAAFADPLLGAAVAPAEGAGAGAAGAGAG